MALDTRIPLTAQTAIVDPIGSFQASKRATAVTKGQELANASEEQKQQMRDAAQADFELEAILKGDPQTAQQRAIDFIQNNQTIPEQEKSQVLQQVQSGDIEGVLADIEQSKAMFEQLGITEGVSASSTAAGGGATGALIDKLKASAAESGEPITDIQALSLIKGFAGQGLTFDEQGNVIAQTGAATAKGQIAGGDSVPVL